MPATPAAIATGLRVQRALGRRAGRLDPRPGLFRAVVTTDAPSRSDDRRDADHARLQLYARASRRRGSCARSSAARSSVSAARAAARSTSRRAARARCAVWRPRRSCSSPARARSRRSASPACRARPRAAVRHGLDPARRRGHHLDVPHPGVRPGRGAARDAGRAGLGARTPSAKRTSATSATSGRPASRTPSTTPTRTTLMRPSPAGRDRRVRIVRDAVGAGPQRGRDAAAGHPRCAGRSG